MKISLINLGITNESYLKEGIAIFEKRIRHYITLDMVYLNEPRHMKNQPAQVQKINEGKLFLSALTRIDLPILLDVTGKQYDSESFARYLQQMMNRGIRHMGFLIGGPYGFPDEVYNMVSEKISFSPMTFSHQLFRLIFLEQLYRAFTIIKGEPYHHA